MYDLILLLERINAHLRASETGAALPLLLSAQERLSRLALDSGDRVVLRPPVQRMSSMIGELAAPQPLLESFRAIESLVVRSVA